MIAAFMAIDPYRNIISFKQLETKFSDFAAAEDSVLARKLFHLNIY